jgi:L-lactate utilization protein LutB
LRPAGKGEDAVEIPAKIMGRGKVVVLGKINVAIETGL